MSEVFQQQYGLNSINLLPVILYGFHNIFAAEKSHFILALIKKFAEAKKTIPSKLLFAN